ncbi:hypothetical protein TrVGV298_007064 [Trichoderma virens]|nr:hypothetical protein TrVGV298_007064 [Trichoderma virens]
MSPQFSPTSSFDMERGMKTVTQFHGGEQSFHYSNKNRKIPARDCHVLPLFPIQHRGFRRCAQALELFNVSYCENVIQLIRLLFDMLIDGNLQCRFSFNKARNTPENL